MLSTPQTPEGSYFLKPLGVSCMQALWHGVPIVCLPGFGDQPDNAARVASQGAGLALPFIWKVREKQLHEALTRLLTEPSFRHAAGAVGKRLRAQKRTGAQQSVGEALLLSLGQRVSLFLSVSLCLSLSHTDTHTLCVCADELEGA